MPPTTLFPDVGGVLLSRGWAHLARKRAAKHFKLNWAEMENRRSLNFETHEEGKLSSGDYLNRVGEEKRDAGHELEWLAEGVPGILRETADVWHSSIDRWMYASATDWTRKFGVAGYYVRIVPSMVTRQLNMFTLIAVIIVLVLLGPVLELRARSRTTGSAIKALLNLAPPTARQVPPGGDHEVPRDLAKIGDRLRVVPGDKAPADGAVVEGHPSVEESMITA